MRVTILLIVVACASAYGQTQKGSWMIGGGMNIQRAQLQGFSGGAVITVPSTSISVSPSAGYFLVDNWVAGLSTTISGSVSKSENDSDDWSSRSRNFNIGPFTRYYFPFGKFAAFPEIAARWGSGRQQYKYAANSGFPDNIIETKTSTYTAGAGIAWFIANNVALEGILSYRRDKGNTDYDERKYVAFNVGLQFYIPAKPDN